MARIDNTAVKSYLKLFLKFSGLTFIAALIFAFIIFPFSDLTDLISTKISEQTNNTVFLQFDSLKVSIVPQPGVQLDNVYVETQTTPALTAESIVAAPSARGIIQKKPYGDITASGILGGTIEVSTSKAPATEKNPDRLKIVINANSLSLTKIKDIANLPLALKGKLNTSATIETDLALSEQPDADVNLEVSSLEIPPANVNLGSFGQLPTPELKLTTLSLKGRLADGTLIIDSATIGKPNDELYGTIKGRIGMNLIRIGPSRVVPQFSAYNLEIDLKAKKSFQDKANLFLTFLDGYKKDIPGGAHFKFKVSAQSLSAGPSINSMH